MESTGEKGRIQVSETTANLLRSRHGKGHWLMARDTLVEAKGKGQLQTYWLVPQRAGSVMSSMSSAVASSQFTLDDDEDDSEKRRLDSMTQDTLSLSQSAASNSTSTDEGETRGVDGPAEANARQFMPDDSGFSV